MFILLSESTIHLNAHQNADGEECSIGLNRDCSFIALAALPGVFGRISGSHFFSDRLQEPGKSKKDAKTQHICHMEKDVNRSFSQSPIMKNNTIAKEQ